MFPGTKHTYNFLLGNRALVDDVIFVLFASSGKFSYQLSRMADCFINFQFAKIGERMEFVFLCQISFHTIDKSFP